MNNDLPVSTLDFLAKYSIPFNNLGVPGRRDVLVGKNIFMVGGCELSYMRDYLRTYNTNITHTFETGSSMDPFTEINNPESDIYKVWDYIFISQVQLYRSIVSTINKTFNFSAEKSNEEIDSLMVQLKMVIEKLPNTTTVFYLTYPYLSADVHGLNSYKYKDTNYLFLTRAKLRQYDLLKQYSNVNILDCDIIFEQYGKKTKIIRPEMAGGHPEMYGAFLIVEHFYKLVCIANPNVTKVKCIIVDLDNTLWTGVIRETPNLANLKVRKADIETLYHLTQRGILIAICSKNDPDEWIRVEKLLKSNAPAFLRKIVTKKLNWLPKSQNIKAIVDELNIDIGTIAFIDDNEFEKNEVKSAYPTVRVYSDTEISGLLDLVEFQPNRLTQDSLERSAFYQQEIKRKESLEQSYQKNVSYEDYLQSTKLKVKIETINDEDLPRAFELLDRTNQLNITLKRTTLEQLINYHKRPETYLMYMIEMSDKYGDYGKIGVVIAELISGGGGKARLIEFALSCRGMGRKIEQVLISHILTVCKTVHGLDYVFIEVTPTSKNKQLYDQLINDINFSPTLDITSLNGHGHGHGHTNTNASAVATVDVTKPHVLFFDLRGGNIPPCPKYFMIL